MILRQLTQGRAARIARALAALILLGLLLAAVDWRPVPEYLQRLSWPLASLAAAGLLAHFIVSPWKWQWALRMHRLDFGLPYLVVTNGIAFFLNNFLPTAIGGDAYRVAKTWPDTNGSRALSAVLVERVIGLVALLALGNIGAILLLDRARIAQVFVLISVIGVIGAVAFILLTRSGLVGRVPARLRDASAFRALEHNLNCLLTAGWRWLPLIVISILFQVIAVFVTYTLFASLGVEVTPSACALIGAVSAVAALLPISINGIGVVEGSFAGAAVALGIDYEAALTVAVLIRLLVLPPSILFGILYAFGAGAQPAALTAQSR